MIGGDIEGTAPTCENLPDSVGETYDTRILVSTAKSLLGPWSEPAGPLLEQGSVSAWDYVVTNPSPIILENGTTYLYYRGTPKYWTDDDGGEGEGPYGDVGNGAPMDLPESVGLAIAPHYTGPYTKAFSQPILSVMNEDPFAWKDDRGFHLLTHGRDDWWNTHYSYSADGMYWSSGADVACDPNITTADGSVAKFTNRERPQIFFNEVRVRVFITDCLCTCSPPPLRRSSPTSVPPPPCICALPLNHPPNHVPSLRR